MMKNFKNFENIQFLVDLWWNRPSHLLLVIDLALPFQNTSCQHSLTFKVYIFLNPKFKNVTNENEARKCQDLYIRVFIFANTHKKNNNYFLSRWIKAFSLEHLAGSWKLQGRAPLDCQPPWQWEGATPE